jgi:hypothetical protein
LRRVPRLLWLSWLLRWSHAHLGASRSLLVLAWLLGILGLSVALGRVARLLLARHLGSAWLLSVLGLLALWLSILGLPLVLGLSQRLARHGWLAGHRRLSHRWLTRHRRLHHERLSRHHGWSLALRLRDLVDLEDLAALLLGHISDSLQVVVDADHVVVVGLLDHAHGIFKSRVFSLKLDQLLRERVSGLDIHIDVLKGDVHGGLRLARHRVLLQLGVLTLEGLDVSVNSANFSLKFVDLVIKSFVVGMDGHLAIDKSIDALLALFVVFGVQLVEFSHDCLRGNLLRGLLALEARSLTHVWCLAHTWLLGRHLLLVLLLSAPGLLLLAARRAEALGRLLLDKGERGLDYMAELDLGIPLSVVLSPDVSGLGVQVVETGQVMSL